MNKKHSELELFMRKFMNRLGLGYQCHYTNRKEKNYRCSNSYPGHWWIEIWDQRPGHYKRFRFGKENRNDGPEQKWYNNQQSDCHFEIIGPEYTGVGSEHKDDFLKWLLFDDDGLIKRLSYQCGKPNYFIDDFLSKEKIILVSQIIGNDLTDIFEEFDYLKNKYT